MVATRPESAPHCRHRTPAALALSAMLTFASSTAHAGIVGPSSDMIQPGFEYATSPGAQPNPIVNLSGPSTTIQSLSFVSTTGQPTPVGTAEIVQDFFGEGTLDLLSAAGVSTRYSGAFNGLLSSRRRDGSGGTRATVSSSVLSLRFNLTPILGGAGVHLRASPIRSGTGSTTVEDLGNGTFRVESFFDIFVDLSFDGGQNWYEAAAPLHLDLVPSPTVATAFFVASGLTIARRRR